MCIIEDAVKQAQVKCKQQGKRTSVRFLVREACLTLGIDPSGKLDRVNFMSPAGVSMLEWAAYHVKQIQEKYAVR